ncbi:hypothetical protein PS467_16125 [Streptomyces luomodiensis]|uniref:Secreted protein n=1 Tax=Streptomyces luomodiensis TaxID=3026192 RepID=A0ABY9VHY0_9ACTN|nr:hypothetical protein [Streptomyces sp. SCA4-21]WNF01575.1 hypothetical protein PS467_16125 [Streptomyces sp. SCA4-21]
MRPPRQATGLRQRLAELRGPATVPHPMDARALAALAANPGCRRRALLDGAGVDKGALARALGAPANFGQSQFAHQRGNSFEARVKADGGADLVRLLHERLRDGSEPPGPGEVATPDLSAPGPQGRTARTALALREATEAGRWALLDHPMVSLDVAGSPAFLEPDAVVVHPDGSWTIVEIKSFPMVDGSADPAKVGAAARQSAVYTLALERVASMIGEPPEGGAGTADSEAPADSAAPAAPTDPTAPADPTAPTPPAASADPEASAGPATLADPAAPADPEAPADPAASMAPAALAAPTPLAGPAASTESADSTDPAASTDSADSARSARAPVRARVRHQVLLVCPKDFSNLPTAEMVDVRKQLAVTRRQLDRLTRIEEIAAALPEGTTFDLRLTDDGRTPTRPVEELTAAVDAVRAAYAPECLSTCELAAHCRAQARAAGRVEALGRGVRGELGGLTTVDAVLRAALGGPAGEAAPTGDPAVDALRRAAALRAEALASRPGAVACR